MLKEIVKRGDAAQKEWALDTLAVSARLRGNREILGELLGYSEAKIAALTEAGLLAQEAAPKENP